MTSLKTRSFNEYIDGEWLSLTGVDGRLGRGRERKLLRKIIFVRDHSFLVVLRRFRVDRLKLQTDISDNLVLTDDIVSA